MTEADFTTIERIELSPPPFCEHLSWEEYRDRVREMIEDIEEDTRERQRAKGTRPLGAAKVMARHPHSRPEHLDRSPAPPVHCSSKEKRASFWEAFKEFVGAYRDAAERLRGGELTVAFPGGCFTPRRQFVPRQCEPQPRARAPGTS
jgi:hypothetical protein